MHFHSLLHCSLPVRAELGGCKCMLLAITTTVIHVARTISLHLSMCTTHRYHAYGGHKSVGVSVLSLFTHTTWVHNQLETCFRVWQIRRPATGASDSLFFAPFWSTGWRRRGCFWTEGLKYTAHGSATRPVQNVLRSPRVNGLRQTADRNSCDSKQGGCYKSKHAPSEEQKLGTLGEPGVMVYVN